MPSIFTTSIHMQFATTFCYHLQGKKEIRKKITVTKSHHCFKLQSSCLSPVAPLKQGRPSDNDLNELAGKIAVNWKMLGLYLGVSQDVLDDIETNYGKERPYAMLLRWRNTTTSTELYRDLYYAMRHHRVLLDNVAREFCGKETTLT